MTDGRRDLTGGDAPLGLKEDLTLEGKGLFYRHETTLERV